MKKLSKLKTPWDLEGRIFRKDRYVETNNLGSTGQKVKLTFDWWYIDIIVASNNCCIVTDIWWLE